MKFDYYSLTNVVAYFVIIFVAFLTNGTNNNMFYYAYIGLNILFLIQLKDKKISKKFLLIFSLLLLAIVGALLFGNNGLLDCAINFSILLILYFQFFAFGKKQLGQNERINKLLYFVGIVVFIGLIIYNYIKRDTINFYFISTYDKNFASAYVFLFYCFCVKRKKYIGALISVILATFFYSRLFYIAVILNIILLFFHNHGFKNKGCSRLLCKIKEFNSFKVFLSILLLTIVTIGISYYTVYNISVDSVSDYRESVYDVSNAIRTRANVYAVEKVKSDWRFIFSGYDSSIRSSLGAVSIYNSTIYLGFRLVQPHNFLLNYVLRYGIILTLLYLALLSKLLAYFLKKGENIVYIIPFLIMNMIMHSLLSSIYLIFFITILNIDSKKEVHDGQESKQK